MGYVIAAYGLVAVVLVFYGAGLGRERRTLREALAKSASGVGNRDAG